MAIVAWDNIMSPKVFGGLGMGCIKMRNIGILLKWWWTFCGEDEPLWKKVLRSIHGIPQQF